jgi:peptidoglycan/LPS O-acetylase OafA/YrhL
VSPNDSGLLPTDDERAATRRPSPDRGQQIHVQALDGLRFFAFLAVFGYHALQGNRVVGRLASYGALGVQVFFVLSGFLIGGILLDLKKIPELSLGSRLRLFYARRALRIFPVYYLTLFALLALEHSGVEAVGGSQIFFWNATYLTNVEIFRTGSMVGGLSHLWSLCVEEHFYLVAPLVVLSCTVRQLSWLCVVTWVAAAVGRASLHVAGRRYGWVLSPLQFDCMTMGIAAAILQKTGNFLGIDARRAGQASRAAAVLAVPVLALRQVTHASAALAVQLFEQLLVSAASAGLVLLLWNAGSSRWAQIFAWGPSPYLGKISYGLYLFHLPCLVLASDWFGFLPHGSAIPALGLTIALASLSWWSFEAPLNNLKQYFPYPTRSRPLEVHVQNVHTT